MEKMSCSCTAGLGSITHNFNKKYRANQEHIDKEKIKDNIILKEIQESELENIFNNIFKEDVEEYNKGKRKDRQITSYYQKVLNDKNITAPFREIIFQVGNKEDKEDSIKQQIMKETLIDFYNKFESRYKNFKVIGAVIHCDEPGAMHLHLDYVPVAEREPDREEIKNGEKRIIKSKGLKHRVSLDKAIEQMGFKEEYSEINKKEKVRPILFNGFRNNAMQLLEDTLQEHGFERDIKNNTEEHLSVKDYKIKQDIIKENERLKAENEKLKWYKKAFDKIIECFAKWFIKKPDSELLTNITLDIDETIPGFKEEVEITYNEILDQEEQARINTTNEAEDEY